jgi:hypothetical protein
MQKVRVASTVVDCDVVCTKPQLGRRHLNNFFNTWQSIDY